MVKYAVQRFFLALAVLLGISLLVFTIAHLIPGDLVDILMGVEQGTPEQMAALRQRYGLDQPIYVQYLRWLAQVLQGELGKSPLSGRPVLQDVLAALPVTLELTVLAMGLAVLGGIPLGIYLAARQNRMSEVLLRLVSLLGMSVPSFIIGMLAILATSLYLPAFYTLGYTSPAQGIGKNLHSLFMPALAMAVPISAIIARMTRAAVLDVLREDYIRTAHAKGLASARVLFRHALKNAMIPIITVIAFQLGYLLGGAIVVEEVFSLPGLGRLVYTAISLRDYPLLQAGVLFIASGYVLVNLCVDLMYGFLDPRIRY